MTWRCDARNCYGPDGHRHCRHEVLTDGTIRCRSGRCADYPPSDDGAAFAAIARHVRSIVGPLGAGAQPTPRSTNRLHASFQRSAPVDAGAVQVRMATLARAGQAHVWGQDLERLARELEGHAAPPDIVVLRRLAARFTAIGERLMQNA